MLRKIAVITCLWAIFPAGAMAQPARSNATQLKEEVAEWTKHLRGLPAARSAATPLREAAERRGKALVELMRAAPSEAYAAKLSPAERQALVRQDPELDAWLEVHGRWRGGIQVLAIDDFERGAGWTEHHLISENQRLELHAIGRPLPAECGWTAEFEGIALNGVAAGFVLSQERAVGAGDCSNLGEQKILGVAVSFPGRQLTISETDISTLLFAPSTPSLDHFLREQTGGQTWVTGATTRVELDRAYGCNEFGPLADAVFRVLSGRGELNKYARFVLFFPITPTESCYGGLGSVNCWPPDSSSGHWSSITWIPVRTNATSASARVIHHELGHNFGLLHSSSRRFANLALGAPGEQGSVAEYGDIFTVMGGGWASYTVRQKRHAGWLDQSQIIAVEAPGTYSIEPVGASSAGPKALRIRRTPGVDAWLWVEYHKPQGPYYSLWPANSPAGALIYYEDDVNIDASDTSGGWTHLLDMTPGSATNEFQDFQDGFLVPGKLWRDAYTGLDLQVDGAGDRLTVTVRRDTPCVTVEPQSREHGPGAETGEFRVTASLSCGWEVYSSEKWIQLLSKNSGIGPGIVSYKLEANTGAGLRRGYLAIGRTTVTIEQRPVNQPPVPVSVDPSAGEGSSLSLRVQVQDPNGPEDVATIAMRVSADESASAACQVEYDVAKSEVRLASDDGTSWVGAKAGYNMTLENSYCRVQSCSFYSSGPG